jgi:excisionase family DNA binding protein
MTPLLDIRGAAKLLSISPWTIRSYIAEGKLTPVRIGRRVLLEESELQRFVASAKQKPASEAQVAEGVE